MTQSSNTRTKTPVRKLTKPRISILKTFKCTKCDFMTNVYTQLAKHKKSEHCDASQNKVNTSGEVVSPSTSGRETMDHDVDSEDSEFNLKFNCMLCGKGFVEEADLRLHEKNAHESKCNQCESVFYTEYDLTLHKYAIHTQSTSQPEHTSEDIVNESDTRLTLRKLDLECEFCPYTTHKAMEFMMHVKTHNNNFICKECPFTSSSQFSFVVACLRRAKRNFLKLFLCRAREAEKDLQKLVLAGLAQ